MNKNKIVAPVGVGATDNIALAGVCSYFCKGTQIPRIIQIFAVVLRRAVEPFPMWEGLAWHGRK